MSKISSKTRMPGKWGARVVKLKYYFIQYVPKYHQKLGCQANGGGARRAHPPPLDPPMIACVLNAPQHSRHCLPLGQGGLVGGGGGGGCVHLSFTIQHLPHIHTHTHTYTICLLSGRSGMGRGQCTPLIHYTTPPHIHTHTHIHYLPLVREVWYGDGGVHLSLTNQPQPPPTPHR